MKMIKCSSSILLLFLLVMQNFCNSLGFANPTAQGKQVDDLFIGAILPLTGALAPYGLEAQTSMILALEDFKKNNPSMGEHVRLEFFDDQSKPSGAKEAANALLAQRPSVVIGSLTKWANLEIKKQTLSLQKPFIIPGSCHHKLNRGDSSIFYTCTLLDWQGMQLARFAAEHLKLTSVGILFDSTNIENQKYLQGFLKQAQQTPQMTVFSQEFRHNDPEASLLKGLAQLSAHKMQGLVFLSHDFEQLNTINAQLTSQNRDIKLMGFQNLKHSKAPVYYATSFSELSTEPAALDFISRFKSKMKRMPSGLSLEAFDAISMATHAFKTVKSTRAEELVRSLNRLSNAPSLLGTLHSDGQGFVRKPSLFIKSFRQQESMIAVF